MVSLPQGKVFQLSEGGIIIEITSADRYFYMTFMQDFSSDVYYRKFVSMIREMGVTVTDLGWGPMLAPRVQMPEE